VPSQSSLSRILITGGGGFVGRHLLRALSNVLPDEHAIIAGTFSSKPSSFSGRVRSVPFDITDADQIRSTLMTERPTHVVHLAAVAALQAARLDARQTWAVNFGGTLNVAMVVSESLPDCRFVYCGSAQVYGGNFRSDRPVNEDTLLDPLDAYGASKAAADLMISQMAKQGMRAIRLRPFNHTGPGQSEGFVVPAFAAQIARIERCEQEPVIRVGNLTGRRDLTDVRDVVDAYVRAVLRFDELPQGVAINIASGKAISIREILDLLLSLSTKKIEIKQDHNRLRTDDISVVFGDASLARSLLGWEPRIAVLDTLSAVLDDYRARGGLP
jgi:GDP-4-dehydro-6-deoxy-D-mannose reductase